MFTSRISCTDEKNTRVFVGIMAADVGKPPSDNTLRKYAGPENGFSETTHVQRSFLISGQSAAIKHNNFLSRITYDMQKFEFKICLACKRTPKFVTAHR